MLISLGCGRVCAGRLVGRFEAEPPVVARVTEQQDRGFVQGVRGGEHAVHQSLSERAALARGQHPQRSQPQRRFAVDVRAAAHHVPDHPLVAFDDQRQARNYAAPSRSPIDELHLGHRDSVTTRERRGMRTALIAARSAARSRRTITGGILPHPAGLARSGCRSAGSRPRRRSPVMPSDTVGNVDTQTILLDNGVRVVCQLSGNPVAPTMVLLHALGEQAASWEDVATQFASSFRVVTLDLRGHGASDWPGTYSFELMLDDVIGVLDHLDLRDIILIGHSMGGTVAYLLAQAQPSRIARLIVEDVPPPYPRTRAVPERPSGALPFDWAVVPAIVAQVNDPTLRYWKHLPDITAPTLLIGGGPDSHIPQDKLVEVSKLVPDCALMTIPAGRNVHESQPAAFAEAVLTWLDTDASADDRRP